MTVALRTSLGCPWDAPKRLVRDGGILITFRPTSNTIKYKDIGKSVVLVGVTGVSSFLLQIFNLKDATRTKNIAFLAFGLFTSLPFLHGTVLTSRVLPRYIFLQLFSLTCPPPKCMRTDSARFELKLLLRSNIAHGSRRKDICRSCVCGAVVCQLAKHSG